MLSTDSNEKALRKKIKTALIITIVGLLLNGVSAIPLRYELKLLLSNSNGLPAFLHDWWLYVNDGVRKTTGHYPFMRYGFDWLGFAHLFIAILFIGPLKDPVKNEWIVNWGMIVSVLSVIMAFGWERMREIPLWWSCIDAAIPIAAFIVLWLCSKWIKQLKQITTAG